MNFAALQKKSTLRNEKESNSPDFATKDRCRICFEETGEYQFLSPCKCKGSLEYVHFQCLTIWLSTTNRNSCEICHYKYKLEFEMKPFSKWSCPEEIKELMFDLYGDMLLVLLVYHLFYISLSHSKFIKALEDQPITTICQIIANILLLILMVPFMIINGIFNTPQLLFEIYYAFMKYNRIIIKISNCEKSDTVL